MKIVSRFLFPFLLAVTVAIACQVPVFRYALERWQNDPYQAFIVSEGELVGEAKAAFEHLRAIEDDFKSPANVYSDKIDLSKEPGDSPIRQHVREGKIELPAILLYYPDDRLKYPPIWTAPATKPHVQALAGSPVRAEIIRRILTGDSAVWVFVECGDKALDDAAYLQLQKHIKEATKELVLPEGVIAADKAQEAVDKGQLFDQSNVLRSEIPLKLAFSQLRVSRTDAAEQPFLQMLLHCEPDLGEFKAEPMVFPVFGRGRALEPLIGKGLTLDNVWDYCAYITGACSCEVKKQNPGVDLLTALDWDAVIEGSQIIIDKVLPPLEGVASLLHEPGIPKTDATVPVAHSETGQASVSNDSPQGSSMGRNIGIAICVMIGVVFFGSLLLRRGSN